MLIWCFRLSRSKVTQLLPNWDLNSQSKASVIFQNLQRYASVYLQWHACLYLEWQACLCLLWKLGSNRNYSNYCSTAIIGCETENLSWTQGPPTRFVIETFQLIALVVCCGCVLNLIGCRTMNIPEVILGIHGLMGFTLSSRKWPLIWIRGSRKFSICAMHDLYICEPLQSVVGNNKLLYQIQLQYI